MDNCNLNCGTGESPDGEESQQKHQNQNVPVPTTIPPVMTTTKRGRVVARRSWIFRLGYFGLSEDRENWVCQICK